VAGGVAAYVSAVRAELSDLPAEDVDDLTGGMEADLSELAEESGGDLIGRLGSPALYAAELRAAAGLPERAAGPVRSRPLGDAVAQARASFATLTEQRPWLASTAEFLVTLRPAWWVLRGYLAAWALWSLFGGMRGLRPQGLTQFVLALGAVVLSVRLGRGWLRQSAGLRHLLVLANATAVVVALVALTSGVTAGEVTPEATAYGSPQGVALDGEPVTNIYPYDSAGRRIIGVRLFDQAGRPLTGAESSVDGNGYPVAVDAGGNPTGVVRDISGAPLLNVYPRTIVGSDPWLIADPGNPTYVEGGQQTWSPPVSIVPLASSPRALVTPTPMPTPSATKSARSAPATPQTSTPTRAPAAKPVLPTPASPTPSSVPRPSVTRSGG